VFSKCSGKYFWVPIIEKALAKAHGSYYAIEEGFLKEAVRILTGAPTFSIKIKE
jgi:calpain-15